MSSSIINTPDGPVFDSRNFQILEVLGHGSFGVVTRVQEINTQEIFAIKTYSLEKIPPRDVNAHLEEINREYNILNKSNDKNILKVYAMEKAPNKISLLMDYHPFNLETYIRSKPEKVTPQFIQKLFVSGVEGLWYLSRVMKACHRDIKPENILISESGDVKLCDFGNIKIRQDGKIREETVSQTLVGTKPYMAPEIIKAYFMQNKIEEKLNYEKCDVFSFALVILRAIGKQEAFKYFNSWNTDQNELKKCYFEFRDSIPRKLRGILQLMIAFSARRRPDLDMLHVFIGAAFDPDDEKMEVIEFLQRELAEKNKMIEMKDKEIDELIKKRQEAPVPLEVKPPKTLQPATPLPMTSSQFFKSMRLSFKGEWEELKPTLVELKKDYKSSLIGTIDISFNESFNVMFFGKLFENQIVPSFLDFNRTKVLRLSFSGYGFWTDSAKFLAELIKNMPDLEEVVLDLGYMMNTQDFILLCKAFSRLTFLRILHLSAECNNIDQTGLVYLFSCLSKLYKLSDLKLSLKGSFFHNVNKTIDVVEIQKAFGELFGKIGQKQLIIC